MQLKNKIALVTGGHRRVGRAISLELAKHGMHVAVTYKRHAAEAQQTVVEIGKLGVRGVAVACDLARLDEQGAARLHQELRGFGEIDLLVNNASIYPLTPFGTVAAADWDAIFHTNLRAIFFLSQEFGIAMRKRGAGNIINIVDCFKERPSVEHLPYAISKGALVTLTQGLARALSPQVRVNAIHPGWVLLEEGADAQTYDAKAKEKILLKRMGTPQDVASMVRFLAGEAQYCTGGSYFVDGGRSLV